MFCEKLRTLIWKNFVLRKKYKFRWLLQFFLPVFLFLILIFIRRGDNSTKLAGCDYPVRPLPSAGEFPFIQNLICNTLISRCFEDEKTADSFNPESFIQGMKDMINKKEGTRKKREIKDEYLYDFKNKTQFHDTDLQEILKIIKKKKVAVKSNEEEILLSTFIKNPKLLSDKWKNIELNSESISVLLKLKFAAHKLNRDVFDLFKRNSSSVLCNATLINHLLVTPVLNDSLSVQLCNLSKSNGDLFNLINNEIDSDDLIQIVSFIQSKTFKIISWKDWTRLVRFFRSFIKNAVNSWPYLEKISINKNNPTREALVSAVQSVFCSKDGIVVDDLNSYVLGANLKAELNPRYSVDFIGLGNEGNIYKVTRKNGPENIYGDDINEKDNTSRTSDNTETAFNTDKLTNSTFIKSINRQGKNYDIVNITKISVITKTDSNSSTIFTNNLTNYGKKSRKGNRAVRGINTMNSKDTIETSIFGSITSTESFKESEKSSRKVYNLHSSDITEATTFDGTATVSFAKNLIKDKKNDRKYTTVSEDFISQKTEEKEKSKEPNLSMKKDGERAEKVFEDPDIFVDDFEEEEERYEDILYSIAYNWHGFDEMWTIFGPLLMGKIYYVPKTVVTDRIMAKLNKYISRYSSFVKFFELFQSLNKQVRNVRWLRNHWSSDDLRDVEEFLVTDLGQKVFKSSLKRGLSDNVSDDTVNMYEKMFTGYLYDKTTGPEVLLNEIEIIITFLKTFLKDRVKGFSTEESAVIKATEEGNHILAVIVFEDLNSDDSPKLPPLVKYKIRMLSDFGMFASDSLFNVGPAPVHKINQFKYFANGFIYLQDILEQLIIAEGTGTDINKLPVMYMQMMPAPCFVKDKFLETFLPYLSICIIMCWMYEFAMIVKFIVDAKNRYMKISLYHLCVNNDLQWIAWFIDCIVPLWCTSAALTIILKFGKIFENSDIFIIFFCLAFYCISFVCLAFLFSSFFSTSVASIYAGMFFFILYFPFLFTTREYGDDYSLLWRSLMFLNPNAVLIAEMLYIEIFEKAEGVNIFNLFTRPKSVRFWSIGFLMIFLLLDSIIFIVLALYVEAVFPGSMGMPPKPFYCPWKRNKKYKPKEKDSVFVVDEVVEKKDAKDFEEDPKYRILGISIENITMTINNVNILKNITLNLFENEITSIVGRTGAGKTALINILCGSLYPTSGTAYIYGKDVRIRSNALAKTIGVCPYYSTFYNLLTVSENLRFFSYMRNSRGVEGETEEVLHELMIEDEMHTLAKNLNVSTQRRLAIGVAYVGGNKTVLVDEPTTDIDPISRRIIWDFMLKNKKGRTTLLVTNQALEAELADRIALLNAGCIDYRGTPTFLKNRFNGSYKFLISLDIDRIVSVGSFHLRSLTGLTEAIQNAVPSAVFLQKSGRNILYEVEERTYVKDLVCLLDEKGHDLFVSGYTLLTTSLLDILVNILSKPSSTKSSEHKFDFSPLDDNHLPHTIPPQFEFRKPNLRRQFFALLKINFLSWKRNIIKKTLPILLLPLLFMAFLIIGHLVSLRDMKLVLITDLYSTDKYLFSSVDNVEFKIYFDTLIEADGIGPNCNISPKRRKNCPSSATLIKGATNVQQFGKNCDCPTNYLKCDPIPKNLVPPMYKLSSGEKMYDLTQSNLRDWILTTSHKMEFGRLGGFTFGYKPVGQDFNFKTLYDDLKAGLAGTELKTGIKVWFNNRAPESAVVLLNAINNVIYRKLMGKSLTAAHNHGILLTSHAIQVPEERHRFMSKIMIPWFKIRIILLLLVLCLLFASFTEIAFTTRNSNFHSFEVGNGLSLFIFWIKMFICHFVQYIVCILLCIMIFFFFGFKSFLSERFILLFLALIIFFGWACILEAYLLSFMFTNSDVIFVTSLLINFTATIFSNVTAHYLAYTKHLFGWTSGNISKIFLLLPHYCLGDGMISIEIMSMRKDIIERGQMVERVIFTSKSIRGKVSVMEKMINIFSMFLYGLVILIIIIILEKSLFSSLFRRKIIKPTVNEKENEDVIQERERVFNRDVLLNKQNILVSNLCKFYQHGFGKKTEVVNNVSFVVNQGDCFGILGLQNSGKTAIVEVLAGLINPSSGNIRVLGLDLKKDLKMIQAYVGFCPTKVLFNPFLTPKEYLEYFSHLKNIPKNNIKQHISFCLFKFNLTNSANTLVGKLSASEKRNLCIAMTILGKPPILLLDEPSQEMNFISRKQLWDILKSMQVDKHLIIFSSRSISECEILCSRFAIINHGRFKFIGTVNNLKNKFGEGYNMNLQISSLNVNKITKMKNYLRKYVSNCLLLDELSNCLHYHIPNPELYIALTTVEKAIEREMISDYFITKTKIRDVFTKIIIDQQTAVQIDDEIEDKKKHIFPTLLSCCSFLLCLKFFSAGNILYDEDDDLENSDSDDDTDLQSTSSDESDVIKNFFSKLCSPH